MGNVVGAIVNGARALFQVGQSVLQWTQSSALGRIAGQAALAATAVAIAGALRPEPGPEAIRTALRYARPPRFTGTGRARIAGVAALYEAVTRDAYDVWLLHDGQVDGFEQWFLDDDPVTVVGAAVQPVGEKYQGSVWLEWRTGLATETSYSSLTTAIGSSIWPSSCRGDGIASVYQHIRAPDPEYFSRRLPNGETTPKVSARLSKVFDPREPTHDPDDPSTWEWSQNAAVNFLFWLCFAESGPRYDYRRRVLPVIAWWKRAMDVCDEGVPLRAGGTEPRYRQGGGWYWDQPFDQVMAEFLNCFDGWMAADGQGRLKLYAGKLYPPAVVLTDAHVFGWTLTRGRRAETKTSVLEIAYSSPAHRFDMVAADPWPTREDFLLGEGDASQPLNLKWVQYNGQARRLGKRYFKKRNAAASGTLIVDLVSEDGIDVLGERYLSARLGEAAPRILQGLVIEVTDIDMNVLAGTAEIAWIAIDRDIDDWNATEEEGVAPGESGAVAPPELAPPEIVSDYAQATGVAETPVRLVIEVTDPAPTITVTGWTMRYRETGVLSWTTVSPTVTDLGATIRLKSPNLAGGVFYDWQVLYSTALGASIFTLEPPGSIDCTGY